MKLCALLCLMMTAEFYSILFLKHSYANICYRIITLIMNFKFSYDNMSIDVNLLIKKDILFREFCKLTTKKAQCENEVSILFSAYKVNLILQFK